MIEHSKDDEGTNWYKFNKEDIDMLLQKMYDVKFEEIWKHQK